MTETAPEPTRRPAPGWVAWFGRLEMAIGCVALALIFVMVMIQAAQRYSPWAGLSFTGELARFSMVWLTFSVVGVLLTRDGHISLKLVDGIRSTRVLTAVHVFSLLVVAAVAVGGLAESVNLVLTQGRIASPAMRMPMSWLFVVPALGFASLTVRSVVGTYQVLRHGPRRSTLGEVAGGGEVTFE